MQTPYLQGPLLILIPTLLAAVAGSPSNLAYPPLPRFGYPAPQPPYQAPPQPKDCSIETETQCENVDVEKCAVEAKEVCVSVMESTCTTAEEDRCTTVSSQECTTANKQACTVIKTQECKEVPITVTEEVCEDVEEV